MGEEQRFRLGADIGGTFTDVCLVDEVSGAIFIQKVPTTPDMPSKAVIQGINKLLSEANVGAHEVKIFVHGTTIALNAVLQRRTAQVILFVSSGMRDVIEIGRLEKTDRFNLQAVSLPNLVAREHVIEVEERTSATGAPIRPLDRASLETILEQELASAESLAICFMNAHANSDSETLAEGIIREKYQHLPISRSSALWPEIREYERAIVAVLNASVQPIMNQYLARLESESAEIGLKTRLYITRSNGGVMTVDAAREMPVSTMLSGPAAGVVGAAFVAHAAGVSDALTLDIGGTSADVSIIRDGEPVHSMEASVGDFPLVMPSVDVFAIGAGGGSIAWFDDFGLLKLGPQSAGAVPGPACYGRGGSDPTLTDAYLLCGFVGVDDFLGGAMPLDPLKAKSALANIAQRMDVDELHAAENILRVATSNMTSALLPRMTKRGIDPRDFALIAYGGAGPTHACLLAEEIGISKIIIPPTPGTLCALGASTADLKTDHIRTFRRDLSDMNISEIENAFMDLESEGRDWMRSESKIIKEVKVQRSADMRYAGQAFDIEVPVPEATNKEGVTIKELEELFHKAYEKYYKQSDYEGTVQLINIRVRLTGVMGEVPLSTLKENNGGQEEQQKMKKIRTLRNNGKSYEAPVFERSELPADAEISGPAIIQQYDTNTVVLEGFKATVDQYGVLHINLERSA